MRLFRNRKSAQNYSSKRDDELAHFPTNRIALSSKSSPSHGTMLLDENEEIFMDRIISRPPTASCRSLGSGGFSAHGQILVFSPSVNLSMEEIEASKRVIVGMKRVIECSGDEPGIEEVVDPETRGERHEIATNSIRDKELSISSLTSDSTVDCIVTSPKEHVLLAPELSHNSIEFDREKCVYFRVAEVQLEKKIVVPAFPQGQTLHPNFHYPAKNPPPDYTNPSYDPVPEEPLEEWVCLDDGRGKPSPIAKSALDALVEFGYNVAMKREDLWTPHGQTAKWVKKNPNGWHLRTWHNARGDPFPQNSPDDQQVFYWTGFPSHQIHGHDFPFVRSASVIHATPEEALSWVVDSAHVPKYNRAAEKRVDELILQDTMEGGALGGITKTTVNHIRVWGTLMLFPFLLHARALPDKSGYIVVQREVRMPMTNQPPEGILMEVNLGVLLMKRIPGSTDRILLLNVNHSRGPKQIPMVILKKLMVSTASNFWTDLGSSMIAEREKQKKGG